MMEAIQNLLLEHFNIEGTLSPLPGYDDLNFKLVSDEGKAYVVKLMNKNEEASSIAFQCSILNHLEQKSKSLLFPKVISSVSTNDFVKVDINGDQRILWILTWVPGILLGTFKPQSHELISSHGKAVAEMTNALEGFEHPNSKTNHNWLLSEALQNRPYTKHIKSGTRDIVEKIFDTLEVEILPQLSNLPHSVTQNDANENNTLVGYDESGKAKVLGIFDFGDSGCMNM